METLTSELRSTIVRRVQSAPRHELISIVSSLCAHEDAAEPVRAERWPPATGARFVRREADTVFDTTTSLEWTRQNVPGERMSWTDAKAACEKLQCHGGGWRLPTIKELQTLVDFERHSPAIDPIFECQSAYYWTATPYAPSPGDYAWVVLFGYGDTFCNVRGYNGFVRAVRGGQF